MKELMRVCYTRELTVEVGVIIEKGQIVTPDNLRHFIERESTWMEPELSVTTPHRELITEGTTKLLLDLWAILEEVEGANVLSNFFERPNDYLLEIAKENADALKEVQRVEAFDRDQLALF